MCIPSLKYLSALLLSCTIICHCASSSAGASALPTTLPTNAEIVTKLRTSTGVGAVAYAVYTLLGEGIDWVMTDGMVIKYTPRQSTLTPNDGNYNPADLIYPVYYKEYKITINHTDPILACKRHLWNAYKDVNKYVTGYRLSDLGLLSCKFKSKNSSYESSIGWMSTRKKPKELTLPIEVLAQEILNNALQGHPESVKFVQEVAEEKAREEGQPIAVPTNPPLNPPMAIPKPENPTREPEQPKQCKPCQPYPVGVIGYQGPKISVHGIDGTRNGTGRLHYIIFQVQQNPKTCQCRWQETKKLFGHHYYGTPQSGWVNLNGRPRPPSYP